MEGLLKHTPIDFHWVGLCGKSSWVGLYGESLTVNLNGVLQGSSIWKILFSKSIWRLLMEGFIRNATKLDLYEATPKIDIRGVPRKGYNNCVCKLDTTQHKHSTWETRRRKIISTCRINTNICHQGPS